MKTSLEKPLLDHNDSTFDEHDYDHSQRSQPRGRRYGWPFLVALIILNCLLLATSGFLFFLHKTKSGTNDVRCAIQAANCMTLRYALIFVPIIFHSTRSAYLTIQKGTLPQVCALDKPVFEETWAGGRCCLAWSIRRYILNTLKTLYGLSPYLTSCRNEHSCFKRVAWALWSRIRSFCRWIRLPGTTGCLPWVALSCKSLNLLLGFLVQANEDLCRLETTKALDVPWSLLYQRHSVRSYRSRVPRRYSTLSALHNYSTQLFTEHCLELLRSATLCRGDTTLTTFQWGGKGGKRLETEYPIPHQCVDSDMILEWSRKHVVDIADKSILTRPEQSVGRDWCIIAIDNENVILMIWAAENGCSGKWSGSCFKQGLYQHETNGKVIGDDRTWRVELPMGPYRAQYINRLANPITMFQPPRMPGDMMFLDCLQVQMLCTLSWLTPFISVYVSRRHDALIHNCHTCSLTSVVHPCYTRWSFITVIQYRRFEKHVRTRILFTSDRTLLRSWNFR